VTLKVDLEDVPFAILEAVKERILGNRRRLQGQPEPRPRPSLRPRPQLRKFGASSQRWVRPEPAAVPTGQRNIGHLWRFTTDEPLFNDGVTYGFQSFTIQPALGPNPPVLVSGPAVARVQNLLIGYRRTTRLYCGNGSQYVEIEHGNTQAQLIPTYSGFPYVQGQSPLQSVAANVFCGQVDAFNIIILPAGEDRFVVLFVAYNSMAAVNDYVPVNGPTSTDILGRDFASATFPDYGPPYQPTPGSAVYYSDLQSFTTDIRSSSVKRCFICSNSRIREISFPSKMSSLLNTILPPAQTERRIVQTGALSPSGAILVAPVDVPVFTPSISGGRVGMYALYSDANTPEVYNFSINPENTAYLSAESINAWQSLIGGVVRPIPSSLRWVMEDTSAGGAYAPGAVGNQDFFDTNLPFRYGTWRVPNQQPEYREDYTYDPASYSRDIEAHRMRRIGVSPVEEFEGSELYTVSDWGEPDYCRRVCLAMGFTDADLRP